MTAPSPLSPFLTLDDVAASLKLDRRTIERMVSAGELVAIKVRGSVRVSPDDLMDYLHSQREASVVRKQGMPVEPKKPRRAKTRLSTHTQSLQRRPSPLSGSSMGLKELLN